MPSSSHPSGPSGFRRILIPVDIDEPSSWQIALPTARELARASSAKVTVLTVLRDIEAIAQGVAYSLPGYRVLHDIADARLVSLVAESIPDFPSLETMVTSGTVYTGILDTARAKDIDLIVMASHRPAMKDYLLGSNAAKVARHAKCSVLIVRPEADGD